MCAEPCRRAQSAAIEVCPVPDPNLEQVPRLPRTWSRPGSAPSLAASVALATRLRPRPPCPTSQNLSRQHPSRSSPRSKPCATGAPRAPPTTSRSASSRPWAHSTRATSASVRSSSSSSSGLSMPGAGDKDRKRERLGPARRVVRDDARKGERQLGTARADSALRAAALLSRARRGAALHADAPQHLEHAQPRPRR